jgi:parallel beta-helix repeat protein
MIGDNQNVNGYKKSFPAALMVLLLTVLMPVFTAIVNGQVLKTDVVEVNDFGAKGDGISDDTEAIQSAIDYAALNNASVHLGKNKIYVVKSVKIKNGIPKFNCEGVLKGRGTSVRGILVLDGNNSFKGSPVQACTVTANIDMSGGDTYGIYADCAIQCVFENNYIYGFVDNGNKYGLLLGLNSSKNIIRNNRVFGMYKPKNRQFLIMLMGKTLPFGNYFDGNGYVSNATMTNNNDSVVNNLCHYGTHGILLNGSERNIVAGNTCVGQSHRSIVLEPASWYNTITTNNCLEYGSSAILLGYGCSFNEITNNICRADTLLFPRGGEASINCAVGNEGNTITGNIIDAPKNYGIYVAVSCQRNLVANNEIKNYLRAGIALENDWIRPLSSWAVYSRPNFGPSHTGVWAYKNLEGNVIQHNVIDEPWSQGACAIYIAQLGSSTSIINNTISDNIIRFSGKLKHYLYVYEESNDRIKDNVLTNNVFIDAKEQQIFMSRRKGHFNVQKNNGILDTMN